MTKKIVNIGTLDVRKVSKEIVEKIGEMVNIGTYITNDESEQLLCDVKKMNVGNVIKTDEQLDILTINGNIILDKAYFTSIEGQAILTINGKASIDKDVPIELMLQKIHSGTVNGVVIVPSNLSGVMKTKFAINGIVSVYDQNKTYLKQDILLNEDFLLSYFGDENIALNTLVAVDHIDLNAFSEVLGSIQVLKKLVITRDNIRKLKSYLDIDQNNVLIVEAPVHYISTKAKLDEELISLIGSKHLMVDGELLIEDATILKGLGDYKINAKKILCHKNDYELVKSYCIKDNIAIGFIELQPFNNYSTMVINKEYMKSLKTVKIIANYGSLRFDNDINDLEVDNLLLDIKNYGHVLIPENTDQAFYDLVTENYGHINKKNKDKEDVSEDVLYGNMGYLVL